MGNYTRETYQDSAGEWRWRVRERNGQIVAVSGEGYVKQSHAEAMGAKLFGHLGRDDDRTDPCESGMADCGPAAAWDSEGVGACERCAKELGWIAGQQQGGTPE